MKKSPDLPTNGDAAMVKNALVGCTALMEAACATPTVLRQQGGQPEVAQDQGRTDHARQCSDGGGQPTHWAGQGGRQILRCVFHTLDPFCLKAGPQATHSDCPGS